MDEGEEMSGLEMGLDPAESVERFPSGFPPGNPLHISPEEPALRKEETEKFGKTVASQNAWKRANEKRSSKGTAPPKGRAPKNATDFKNAAMSDAIKVAAKGKNKADLQKWSRSVQFASAMIAIKLEQQDFAFTDDESMLLTEAVVDLLEHYNIKMKGTAGVWSNFAYAVGMVCGPRVAALVISNMKQRGAA